MILELRLIETIVSFLRFKYLVEMDRFLQIVCKFQWMISRKVIIIYQYMDIFLKYSFLLQ